MVAIETPHDSFRRVFTSPLLQGVVLVALAIVIALWIEVPNRFPDPDSFYHAGMAELAARGQFPTRFPWLDLTSLRSAYADLHFGYHLTLVPFVAWIGPMTGIRIATITLFTLLAIAFFILLRSLKYRGAFVWTLLLLGSASFVFRLNLAKSQGLAFIALFFGLAALFRRSRTGVFLAAVFAVWISPHWPVFAIAGVAYAIAHVIATIIGAPRAWRAIGIALRESGELLVSMALGIASGFIVNPYFPQNLAMTWQQTVQIALIGGSSGITVGAEWYPLPIAAFLQTIGFLLPLIGLAVIGVVIQTLAIITRAEVDDRDTLARSATFAMLAIGFGVLTTQSQRHIEFFIPFAILFAASGIQSILPWFWPSRIAIGWRRPGGIRRTISSLALVTLLAIFSLGAWRTIHSQRTYFVDGIANDFLRGPASWLREHAPPGAIVFHSDWSNFPPLFLWNRDQRYLVGLDPRFADLTDHERFARWTSIGRGETTTRLAQTIQREFHATYAIITKKQTTLDGLLEKDRDAKLVFGDHDAKVYELRTVK